MSPLSLPRVASLALHPDQFSFLLNSETTEPRVTTPPFVEALGAMVALKAFGPPDSGKFDSDAASKAFFWLMAGFQINIGKLGVFGQYMATSSAREFLIDGPTHNLQGGIRYSFGTAKEGITERH